MKTILVILVCTAISASAQTNFGRVDFTNKYASRIQGVVTRADANKIQINNDGFVFDIKLSDTPTNIQARFNYDAEAEAVSKKAEAEKRDAKTKRDREAAMETWLKQPAPKPDKGSANLEVKITEKNSVYWQFSYVLTIRNPTDEDMKRDYTINYLDKEGFVLDSSTEYNITTEAHKTNIIRGVSLVSVPKARNYDRPDIISSKRK